MPGQVNFLQVSGRHARKSIQQQSKASSRRGEIQQIAKGVSGQTFGPSKQISLGKK
jgi:hypothetical protein